MTLYDQLYELSSPILKNYRDDLEHCDKEHCEAWPDVPFIHYTRENGTHMVVLQPSDQYPKDGEKVRYLFGEVNREGLLQKKMEEHDALMATFGSVIELILYFDGADLVQIDADRARGTIFSYQCGVRTEWSQQSIGGN